MRSRAAFACTLICVALNVASVSLAGAAYQSPVVVSPLEFEVATIKPGGSIQVVPGLNVNGGSCHGVDSRIATALAQIIPPPPLGRCLFTHVSLYYLIARAYDLPPGADRVKAGPGWASSDEFDIQAKAEDTASVTEAQLFLMLRSLLKEQFKLAIHTQQEEVKGYVLVAAKDGSKLKPAVGEYTGMRGNGAMFTAGNAPISQLTLALTRLAGGPVIDQTGLSGGYEFTLTLGSESIFTAVQEQLGLRLESQKVKIDTVVIDQAEKPGPN